MQPIKIAPAKEIEVDVEGVVFTLCFDFNAIRKYEANTGMNVMANSTWTTELSGTAMLFLIWAMLLRGKPELKVDEVGRMFSIESLIDIQNVCLAMWKKAMPDPAEERPTETSTVSPEPAVAVSL
jgi:hypothetical protein